jgi:hypothetical protein
MVEQGLAEDQLLTNASKRKTAAFLKASEFATKYDVAAPHRGLRVLAARR